MRMEARSLVLDQMWALRKESLIGEDGEEILGNEDPLVPRETIKGSKHAVDVLLDRWTMPTSARESFRSPSIRSPTSPNNDRDLERRSSNGGSRQKVKYHPIPSLPCFIAKHLPSSSSSKPLTTSPVQTRPLPLRLQPRTPPLPHPKPPPRRP